MGRLAVLTYNVHCMPGELYTYDELRMNKIVHYLKHMAGKYKIDVIVLNESFHPRLNREFKEAFSDWHVSHVLNQRQMADLHVSLVPPFLWGNMQVNGGVIIATRSQPLSCHSIEYSKSCQFDGLAAKGVMHVEIKKDNQKVHIFGSHLQALELPVLCDSGIRASQLLEFKEMVAKLEAQGVVHQDDVVLYVGDFNEPNPPEKAMVAKAVRCDRSCSCSTFQDARQLDYIMYSTEHRQPTASKTKIVGKRSQLSNFSDHFPLLGLLTF